MIGEEVCYLTSYDKWQIHTVSGTRDNRRSYDILTGKSTSLRRNRSHLKPWNFDIPIINTNFHSRTLTSPQSEIKSLNILGLQHPPKVKYFHNNKYNNEYSLSGPAHPPKVKYSETVPKIVIRHIGDTAYDSYISETLVPLKSAIKPRKQTRFAGDPVTNVKTIPTRRIRPHSSKQTINAVDPDLLIPLELSQSRIDVIQDLKGNLSAVSPRESHQSEQTLPSQPLGQF